MIGPAWTYKLRTDKPESWTHESGWTIVRSARPEDWRRPFFVHSPDQKYLLMSAHQGFESLENAMLAVDQVLQDGPPQPRSPGSGQ